MPGHPHYPAPARLLHWLCAPVIVWALVSGFALACGILPPPLAAAIPPFNVALTTLLIPVFLLRVAYRLSFRAPALPLPARQRRLAHAGHLLLYLATTTSLASGVLMMERPVILPGGVVLPAMLDAGPVTQAFAMVHLSSNVALALLVAGHIAAVYRHQRRGLNVLARMLASAASLSAPPPPR